MVARAVEIKPPTKTRTLSGGPLELAASTILVLPGFTLFYYLLYFRTVGYIYFVSEDSWAEWATFVGWAMAFCLLAWTLFKDKGLRKPVSPTALIAGGRGEPQGAGASRRKGRRFPAPSPPPSPSDEGEGSDMLPTQNPEEPKKQR